MKMKGRANGKEVVKVKAKGKGAAKGKAVGTKALKSKMEGTPMKKKVMRRPAARRVRTGRDRTARDRTTETANRTSRSVRDRKGERSTEKTKMKTAIMKEVADGYDRAAFEKVYLRGHEAGVLVGQAQVFDAVVLGDALERFRHRGDAPGWGRRRMAHLEFDDIDLSHRWRYEQYMRNHEEWEGRDM
jgi:hypothetical protein